MGNFLTNTPYHIKWIKKIADNLLLRFSGANSWAARPFLRPRSRSVPRVTPEGARFLTLPEMPWGGGGGITHTGGSLRLPRGRSAGALGLDRTPSPATTPVDERAGSQPPMGSNSRRSSLSPSDRSGGRRRDSPCMLIEVPPWHRAILNFIEVTKYKKCIILFKSKQKRVL